MVNVNLLKAHMTLNNYTISKLADEMGITSKTLSTKLNHTPENFTQKEMDAMIRILKIKNPVKIFFAHGLRNMQQSN